MIRMRGAGRAVLILGVVALCAGCAGQPMKWSRDGATREEFARDNRECDMESRRAVAKSRGGSADDMGRERLRWQQYEQCMQARGYMSHP
jgi:hypothetical protein